MGKAECAEIQIGAPAAGDSVLCTALDFFERRVLP